MEDVEADVTAFLWVARKVPAGVAGGVAMKAEKMDKRSVSSRVEGLAAWTAERTDGKLVEKMAAWLEYVMDNLLEQ